MDEPPTDPTTRLADELAVIVEQGVRSPLKGHTEADVAALAAIARELADDPSRPLIYLIAAVVRLAIMRVPDASTRQAAAHVLDIDVDPAKTLDDLEIPVERRKLGADRRPKAASALGVAESSYGRRLSQYEWPLLEAVAEQIGGLWAAHHQEAEKDAARGRRHDRERVVVAVIGTLLVLVGIAWLFLVTDTALK